ncbi:hypothetical protein TL16_g09840 [Triparma laevis f. inornata]|nr:hypothetical protein TL16_g09840 [Triparma laevis f. inornata]
MARMYFFAGIAGGICLGLLIGGGYFDSLEAVSVTIKAVSNTGGLIAIVLLLGYGLVEFPRSLWSSANMEQQLELSQADAAVEYKAFGEMSLSCSMSVANVVRTRQAAEKTKNLKHVNACNMMMLDCPKEFRSGHAGTALANINIDTLANLRRRLRQDASNFEICKSRLERIKLRAYFLEDVIASRREHLNDPKAEKVIHWSFGEPQSTKFIFDWYHEYRPWAMRISSIILTIMSLSIYFAYIAVMLGYSSGLSFFTYVTHRENAHVPGITVFTLITLVYFSFIMFWSLAQMRLAGQLELIIGETTPYSLSFNARMCCRLAPPLVFSYFGLIYENGIESGEWLNDRRGDVLVTAFSKLFGEIAVIPFIGSEFNTFFPTVLIVLSVIQSCNLINRLLVFCRLPQFQFGTEFVTEDQMMEGRRQLLKHRKQMERSAARDATRKKIADMRGKKGFFGMFKGTKSQSPTKGGETELRAMPQEISGWVEKKAPKQLKTLVMSAWENRMFVCRAPGVLSYYGSMKTGGKPKGAIELRIVINIKRHAYAKEKEATHLDLIQSDRVFKMKFANGTECERWEKALLEWKDYALDYGHESGSSGGGVDVDTSYDEGLETESENDSPRRAGSPSHDEDTRRLTESDSMRESWGAALGKSFKKKKSPQKGGEDTLTARIDLSKRKRDSIVALKTRASTYHKSSSLELVDKPKSLKGNLQTKVKNGLFSSYATRYFELNEGNGLLFYYKSEALKDQPPLGCIDLHLVLSIEDTKGNHTHHKEATKFFLDLGEDNFKMKAKTREQAREWKEGLTQWQEYLLLHMGGEEFEEPV